MKSNPIFLLPLLLFFACSNQKANPIGESEKASAAEEGWHISSKTKWLADQGLINVESIIYDEANQVFYASNGENYEVGTSGFISRISKSGTLLELKWASALNRPTGMAIHDSLLYVADVNSLLVINTRNGHLINKYSEPVPNSGLNDVAVNKRGEVYVSASFIHSIIKLEDGKLNLWLQDEEQLKWANGLTINDKQLTVAGLNLSAIDLASKEISNIQVNNPVEDFDGIVPDGAGGYFLTTVENSGLFHLDKSRNITKLLAEDIYFGDLEFNSQRKEIYIPRGNKQTKEFFISVLKIDNSSTRE